MSRSRKIVNSLINNRLRRPTASEFREICSYKPKDPKLARIGDKLQSAMHSAISASFGSGLYAEASPYGDDIVWLKIETMYAGERVVLGQASYSPNSNGDPDSWELRFQSAFRGKTKEIRNFVREANDYLWIQDEPKPYDPFDL